MKTDPDIELLSNKSERLRNLHNGSNLLVLANVWDAGGARIVESAGFPAIATTSAGVSRSLGFEDGEKAPVSEMIAAASRVARAVEVPVTVDLEAGYGLEPDELVRELLAAGAVGFNFEDTNHPDGGLTDVRIQAGRISALKQAGRDAGVDLVLNARVDVFVRGQGTLEEQVAEGLLRANHYRDAGADCIYPILLSDRSAISKFVDEVETINLNLNPGGGLSLQDARDLGARRVSYTVALYRESMNRVEQMADEIYSRTRSL